MSQLGDWVKHFHVHIRARKCTTVLPKYVAKLPIIMQQKYILCTEILTDNDLEPEKRKLATGTLCIAFGRIWGRAALGQYGRPARSLNPRASRGDQGQPPCRRGNGLSWSSVGGGVPVVSAAGSKQKLRLKAVGRHHFVDIDVGEISGHEMVCRLVVCSGLT